MKLKVVVGVALIVGALIFLIVDGLRSSTAYYLTVSELVARGEPNSGRTLRVHGFADPRSIHYDRLGRQLTFRLFTDQDTLNVIYHGVKPDQLAEAQEVVLEGKLVDGSFRASKIMLKCPSKYEAKRQQSNETL
ncbi:MAG: cytochrome c maturation protein CcmE [candidate division KSB1 bacterium]|nr:cytochrome c maturation protein CcmE [candidate division KSB1 bacterium]MDZ7345296.1 cytochrome c maturation protein CcmE [candidate division KSB1 bacterium]